MNEIKYIEDGVSYSLCQGKGRVSIVNLFKAFGV